MECRNVARLRNPAYGMQKCGETVQRGDKRGAQAHEIETDEKTPKTLSLKNGALKTKGNRN